MKKIYLLALLLGSIGSGLFAQETLADTPTRKPHHLALGLSKSFSNFRDLATSPLRYVGTPTGLHLAWQIETEQFNSVLHGQYQFGTFNNAEGAVALSQTRIFEGGYRALFGIKPWSGTQWQTLVGGHLLGNATFRSNGSLGNQGSGYEFFAHLMAAAQVRWDISRTEARQKRFLFWKYTLKPRKRHLRFGVDVGLVNTYYRNAFNYSGQSSLLNAPNVFDHHEYKVGGFRMNTALDYTFYLQNGNGFRFRYAWSAYHSGYHANAFELAQHQFAFILLFKTR